MPKFSKETASDVREMGPVTDRREVMNGYTVEFVSFGADADLDGPLSSLPATASARLSDKGGWAVSGELTTKSSTATSRSRRSFRPPA